MTPEVRLELSKRKTEILGYIFELRKKAGRNDPEKLCEYIEWVITIRPRAGELKAELEALYEVERGSKTKEYLMSETWQDKPISAINRMVDGEISEILVVATLADELASSCTHAEDGARSLLSYLKAERANINSSKDFYKDAGFHPLKMERQ